MVRICLCAALIAFGIVTIHAAQVPTYDLPVDPSTPIITMKYVGGVTELPRQTVYPVLTVQSDGRVIITDTLGRAKPFETSISEEEVQELLRFSLKEQEFLEFTNGNALQDIAIESAQCGRSVRIKEDGGTTIIHIRTADLDHEASFNSLGFFCRILSRNQIPGAALDHREETESLHGRSESRWQGGRGKSGGTGQCVCKATEGSRYVSRGGPSADRHDRRWPSIDGVFVQAR
jgi:hypothetical protein